MESFHSKDSPTKRAPDAGDSGEIPSLFLRLIIFPVGRRPAARPSAGNANRWQELAVYFWSMLFGIKREVRTISET